MDAQRASGHDSAAPGICPSCHGAGTTLMSLCCGRGCATCPGDGLMQQVQCYRCRGTGHLPPHTGSHSTSRP